MSNTLANRHVVWFEILTPPDGHEHALVPLEMAFRWGWNVPSQSDSGATMTSCAKPTPWQLQQLSKVLTNITVGQNDKGYTITGVWNERGQVLRDRIVRIVPRSLGAEAVWPLHISLSGGVRKAYLLMAWPNEIAYIQAERSSELRSAWRTVGTFVNVNTEALTVQHSIADAWYSITKNVGSQWKWVAFSQTPFLALGVPKATQGVASSKARRGVGAVGHEMQAMNDLQDARISAQREGAGFTLLCKDKGRFAWLVGAAKKAGTLSAGSFDPGTSLPDALRGAYDQAAQHGPVKMAGVVVASNFPGGSAPVAEQVKTLLADVPIVTVANESEQIIYQHNRDASAQAAKKSSGLPWYAYVGGGALLLSMLR